MKKVENILVVLLGILLILPILQKEFAIFNEERLNGYFEDKSQQVDFNIENWLNESYQENTERQLRNNIGLRNTLVRIKNQFDFSLFNKSKVVGFVVGKDDYLFGKGYIDAYYGIDFEGESKIIDRVEKIKKLQDTLNKIGIKLLIGIAPGKASYMPENLPSKWVRFPRDSIKRNYDVYKTEFDKSNINYIDFLSWFSLMKDTTNHFLYPKTGIHWSKYGEYLAIDSISKYISHQFHLFVPDIKIESINRSTIPRGTDDDIEKSMNLLKDISDLEMSYPDIRIDSVDFQRKTSILVVADSYFVGFYEDKLVEKLFGDYSFWYYNKEIMHLNREKELVIEIDKKKRIEKKKVIYVQVTEPHLNGLGFGFFEQVYEAYFEPDIYNNKLRIREVINSIKLNPKWFESVKEKAKERGITIDKCLEMEAIYVIKTQL